MDLRRLEEGLRERLGFVMTRVAEIDPGQPHNNRLLHLRAVDGREAVAKIYFRDDRHRLDREYTAVSFLHGLGFGEVATPYLRDDAESIGVYSFEQGVACRAAELNTSHMDALAAFAARLRGIRPGLAGAVFRNSTSATFSLWDQVSGIRGRLALFEAFVAGAEVFDAVRALERDVDIAGEVERLIRRGLMGLAPEVVQARIPECDRSLSTGDLAPHNLLIRPDGGVCVLDLEYSGWDDPGMPVADFLTAESSRGLSAACAQALVRRYGEIAGLSADEMRRARRVRALMEVGWLGVHLSLLVPHRFASKQFADPNFQVTEHVATHVGRFRERLATADRTLDVILAE
jgi:hypothetical protein